MNAKLSFTYTVNQTDYSIIISCRTQISCLTELDLIEAYLVNAEAIILILQSEKNKLFKNLIFLNINLIQTKTVLSNEIIIYKKQETVN